MLFFITNALADAGSSQSGGIMSFLPMIAFIGILYFLLIRPQQKRQKQHQALVSAIKKGDKVVTNSGFIATVSKILNDQEIILEISDGVHCKFVKSAISSVISKDALATSDSNAKKETTGEIASNVNDNSSVKKLTTKTNPISKN